MLQPPWVFTAPTDLPDDPATLQAILRAALSEIERLQLLIAGLQRNRFGRRSERLDDETLQHGIEDLEQSLAQQAAALEAAASPPEVPAPDAKATPRRTEPPKRNRGALPAHLPRVEVVIDVEVKACACCGGALHQIGEDRAEMLDYVPAQLRVRVIRRPRYGCRACEQAVVQAPAPERPIDGGMATEALLAHVLVNKFADHLPLYRQSQIFARQGVTLDRSTLCNWVGRACWWLAPMHELILSTVLSSPKVVADDTTLPVLDPGRGRTKTGRLWCYATDNRGWCGPGYPAAAYLYTEDRKAEHPVSHLNGFRGLLQVDGYAGFARLVTSATEGAPRLAFCWAHARRKFYDIHVATKSPLAQEALTQIAALYAIEAEIRGQPAEQRQFVRRQRSRPLVEAMHGWLHRQLDRLSGRSALAQAIRYALNHWKGLILFLDDGRLELDTNIVERAMRPVALGRKNALFAGADSGAHNWSIIATLIQSAKLNEVEPLAWLADVLQRIVSGQTKRNQLHTLLPWNWKAEDEVPILNSA
jgi:transposase